MSVESLSLLIFETFHKFLSQIKTRSKTHVASTPGSQPRGAQPLLCPVMIWWFLWGAEAQEETEMAFTNLVVPPTRLPAAALEIVQ